jgi:hypothetical protein
VSRARAIRLFWIGAAAILVVAALLALFAVLGGSFDGTDWKILGSLATLLLGGAVATVGVSLRETERSPTLGTVLLAGGPVLALIGLVAMAKGWSPDSLARIAGIAHVLLGAGLVVGTSRVLVRTSRQRIPYGVVAGSAGLAALLGVVAIASGNGDDWKALVALLIVMMLAYVLVPVTRRIGPVEATAAATSVRLDLASGAAVSGVHVRLAEPTATVSGDTVVLVLTGKAASNGVTVAPGEALLAPAGSTVQLDTGAQAVLIGPR